ncbi:hypothetical protein B0H21DRAFT_776503 [Amylocystis lapponica]|nr:hypothetical protein B0H21DRAFT_776503 [Amylocystis lapponica]
MSGPSESLDTTPKRRQSALALAPRKRPRHSDRFSHVGRHFGRTIHAMLSVTALVENGLVREVELAEGGEDDLTRYSAEERREHIIFRKLVALVPELTSATATGDYLDTVASIQHGMDGARADDTKGLKEPMIDWITPMGGQLNPAIKRNKKAERGFQHDVTGALLCPVELNWDNDEVKVGLRIGELTVAADSWPRFMYRDNAYDPENPWKGLLRGKLLVTAFKHIFTSPTSVDDGSRATRAGNARIHGMTSVTPGSIAYVATQVRFALSSAEVFSRSDTAMNSAGFYDVLLELLTDEEDKEEIDALFAWWNRQVFPNSSAVQARVPTATSALARIRAARAVRRATQ